MEVVALSLAGLLKFFYCFVTKVLCFSSNLSQVAHFSIISNTKTSHKRDRLYCLKLTGEVSLIYLSQLSFPDDTIQPPGKKYFCKG